MTQEFTQSIAGYTLVKNISRWTTKMYIYRSFRIHEVKKDQNHYVMKIFKPDQLDEFQQEVKSLSIINHKNVVKMIEKFEESTVS